MGLAEKLLRGNGIRRVSCSEERDGRSVPRQCSGYGLIEETGLADCFLEWDWSGVCSELTGRAECLFRINGIGREFVQRKRDWLKVAAGKCGEAGIVYGGAGTACYWATVHRRGMF